MNKVHDRSPNETADRNLLRLETERLETYPRVLMVY